MMASLASEVFGTQMVEFFGRFGRFGGTVKQLAELAGNDNLMKKWVALLPGLIAPPEKNPYEQSIDQQLIALRRANDEERWGLTEAVFDHLASTAPVWPEGKHAYRSFRIRFGEGDEGVAKTFEAHCARIQRVFGEGRYWCWGQLLSRKFEYTDKSFQYVRLLNGNNTHHAVVEWIVADLDTHRKRESVTAVRDSKSLADELLVMVWLFPDVIRAIDNVKLPGLIAAGYEVSIDEHHGGVWQGVVVVHFQQGPRQVNITAYCRSDGGSYFSVPSLRESLALGA